MATNTPRCFSRAAGPASPPSWACRSWVRFRCRPGWRSWPTAASRSSSASPIRRPASRYASWPGPSLRARRDSLPLFRSRHHADVRALAAIMLALQSAPRVAESPDARHALRAGLDTLYGGDFEGAAAYFAALAARAPTDPAPVVFQAGAYIWWAAARDSADFA